MNLQVSGKNGGDGEGEGAVKEEQEQWDMRKDMRKTTTMR